MYHAHVGFMIHDGACSRSDIAMAQSVKLGNHLTPEEQEAGFVEFAHKMAKPSRPEEDFFRARRKLGKGVGLSETGELVYERDA